MGFLLRLGFDRRVLRPVKRALVALTHGRQFAKPLLPCRTKYIRYFLSNDPIEGDMEKLTMVQKDTDYVSDTSNIEDRDITVKIQKGLACGTNEHFVYGRLEAAIVHFHKEMNELMPKVG